jgi:hypothetical protein
MVMREGRREALEAKPGAQVPEFPNMKFEKLPSPRSSTLPKSPLFISPRNVMHDA